MEVKKEAEIEIILTLFLAAFFAVCWIVNLIQFFSCDFQSSYQDEVIHAIGIIVPPTSIITVWF